MKKRLLLTLLGGAILPALQAQYLVIYDTNEFDRVVMLSSKLGKLAGDMRFVEGPVWVPREGGYLVFSDIPANELKKWSVKEDEIVTFRQPSNHANGNCLDKRGRLITAEHTGRRLSITERNGTVHTLVDQFEGKKLNSPNDVVVKSDGTVWFTDPDYGLGNNPKEQAGNFVFRFDPRKKDLRVVARDFDKPNGLCFSPDERRLYVADSGKPKHIRVFDVLKDGSLAGGDVFCQIERGAPDGIRCDAAGRLYSSGGEGVYVFAPNGKLLGKIMMPESPANLAFGGRDGQTLFITARTSLYAIRLAVKGARLASR
jgi:gluconolactonase